MNEKTKQVKPQGWADEVTIENANTEQRAWELFSSLRGQYVLSKALATAIRAIEAMPSKERPVST
jgi:hypothetical protein